MQDLHSQDSAVLVFDDKPQVWASCPGNLVPVHPYRYWQGASLMDRYWNEDELACKAYVLGGIDELVEDGPVQIAWKVPLDIVDNVVSQSLALGH